MMQEKKKLDDMAEKYKEEMMRIYNKKREAEQQLHEQKPDSEVNEARPETGTDDKHSHTAESDKECSYENSEYSDENSPNAPKTERCGNQKEACGDEPVHENAGIRDNERLMHPPMPKIPYSSDKRSHNENSDDKSPESCGEKNCASDKTKFPTAEELINMDSDNGEGKAVPAAAMHRTEHDHVPDARFESDMNDHDEIDNMDGMNYDNNDGHAQGNYNFNSEPDAEFEKEMEDFEHDLHNRHKMQRKSGGQGYLQAEVTDQGSGSPVSGATVVVVRKLGDSDSLEAILTTDSHGLSESITLDVPDDLIHSGMSSGSEPYEEYMVTVYKEGYYSVNMLPVPIFDTIKSIQPVEMTRLRHNDSD